MSEKALALIFINLGGEMLYVLDQRLFAQKINREKGNKSKLVLLESSPDFSPKKSIYLGGNRTPKQKSILV